MCSYLAYIVVSFLGHSQILSYIRTAVEPYMADLGMRLSIYQVASHELSVLHSMYVLLNTYCNVPLLNVPLSYAHVLLYTQCSPLLRSCILNVPLSYAHVLLYTQCSPLLCSCATVYSNVPLSYAHVLLYAQCSPLLRSCTTVYSMFPSPTLMCNCILNVPLSYAHVQLQVQHMEQ